MSIRDPKSIVMPPSQARSYKLIGTKQVAELLLPFAGSGAEWFMTATQLVSRESTVSALELVAWQAGRELGRWPLHAMAYGSLVCKLVKEPEGPFAIPHSEGFAYDEYAKVSGRLAEAQAVLGALVPVYNALIWRISQTEATAGLSVVQVKSWQRQAEHTLAATKGLVLKQLMREVGPPRYAAHSSCLTDLLPSVQQGTQVLKEFLASSLPPTSKAHPGERATVRVEDSKWHWTRLTDAKGYLSTEEVMQMSVYAPEIDFLEAPSADADEELQIPRTPTFASQLTDNQMRTELLEIRKRIDGLLTNLG